MKRKPFVKLAFTGVRFEGARLPADASVNISIYEKILIELAKQIWRDEHPNRLKLPKNFARYFQLQLGKIKDGSAVAELPRFEEDLPPLFGDFAPEDIFDKAQDEFVKIIDAANENRPIPRLSAPLRTELHHLRKNLRSSEDIVITRCRRKRKEDCHRVSQQTKEKITKELREERSQHIQGFGLLNGMSESSASITVVSEHGLTTFEVNFQTIREEYAGKNGYLVNFDVVALVDYDGQIKKLNSVNSVSLVTDTQEMKNAVDRVEDLGGIEEGWLDGEGEEVSKVTLLFSKDLARYIASFTSGVGIFPTLDGGISVEYTRNELEWTVLIKEQSVWVEVMSLETDEMLSRRFRGASANLLKVLISQTGIVDD